MGCIDKYCPHCASEKVFVVEMHFDHFEEDTEFEFENAELYYECGDCHSTWEPHDSGVQFYGTS